MEAKSVNEVIWDNDYVRITYLGMYEGNGYWKLMVYAVNKTDEEINVNIVNGNILINGCKLDAFGWSFILEPLNSSIEEFDIEKQTANAWGIKNLEDFENLELNLNCRKSAVGFNKPESLENSSLIDIRPVYYLNELDTIIDEIEKNGIWKDKNSLFSQSIEFDFKHIDSESAGKQETIDLYLISHGGTYEKVSRLYDRAHILIDSEEKLHIIELIIFSHRKGNGFQFSTEIISQQPHHNNELRYFLDKYNRIMHLYNKMREISSTMAYYDTLINPTILKAQEVCEKKSNEVREERDKIYADLIVGGETSGRWKSEQQLFMIVRQEYEDAVYQYRPEWLGNQSLDIFIPSLNMGIEYQGIQHYKPNELFGGEEGYAKRRELDIKKKKLCEDNGVKLIYWEYSIPLTEENFKNMIKSNLENP